MLKLNLFLTLLVAVAVSTAEVQNDIVDISIENATNIQIIRSQHEHNLFYYDEQLEIFKVVYNGSLDAISLNSENLFNLLAQIRDNLDALEILNSSTKYCINSFRSSIPKVDVIKTDFSGCIRTAENHLNDLLKDLLATKKVLENYYSNYEDQVANCSKAANYNVCFIEVVANSISYTVANQKQFNNQFYTAKLLSDIHIRNALTCSFEVRNRAIFLSAEAKTYINKCRQCNLKNSCANFARVNKRDICSNCKTMPNPFYGRDVEDCLMLNITN